MNTLRDIYDAVNEFAQGMGRRRITTYAGAGAYYLFMSLVPLIMLMCSLIQYTPLTEDIVLSLVRDYVPESMYVLVQRIVSGVYNSSATTLTLSVVLTLWSASGCLKALMRGLDSVYDLEREENYLAFSIRAIFYMIVFVAMLLLSFFVMVYGERILELLEEYLFGELSPIFDLLRRLRFIAVMAVLTLVFALLYRWMPASRRHLRHQWPGAIFAAVVWVVFSWGFSLYISVSGKFGAYGFLGTIMISMIWMYYCLYFLLLGGYINNYIDKKRDGVS